MTMNDILNGIEDLAASQGFYGRLYNRLMEIRATDINTYNAIATEWESHKFNDIVDFILYIEC